MFTSRGVGLLAVGLCLAACGSTTTVGTVEREPEPTTTYVPKPSQAPLFDLLATMADYEVFTSAGRQVEATFPDAVILGEVIAARVNPEDPDEPTPGYLNSVHLSVRVTESTGDVHPDAGGVVIVETYRSPIVTRQWIEQANDFGGDTLFIVRNEGDDRMPTVTHPMGLFRSSPDGGLRMPAAQEFAAPKDVAELTPAQAYEIFAGLLR